MINKVQAVKSLRSVIWYMLNDEAHDDSGQRYLMAAGEGCTPANALSVMQRQLAEAGRLDKGVQGFSWVTSYDLSEFDPTNPDDVERAMKLTMEASRRRSAGDPPRQGIVTRKLFVAQSDGKSGCLHIHEVEVNVIELDVEYTTMVGSRTIDNVDALDITTREPIGRMRAPIKTKLTKTSKAGRALPAEFRDVFRGRRIANEVYLEHTGRSNDDLMAEHGKGKGLLTWDQTRRALIDFYVSQPDVQQGGLTVLEQRMADEGHATKRRVSTKGKSSAPTWITTSATGSEITARRWASLGNEYNEDSLRRRLENPEPALEYPKNIRLTKQQKDRLAKEARVEAEAVRQVQTMVPTTGKTPEELMMEKFQREFLEDMEETDRKRAQKVEALKTSVERREIETPEPAPTVRQVIQHVAEEVVETTPEWVRDHREQLDVDEERFTWLLEDGEDDPVKAEVAQDLITIIAGEREKFEKLLAEDQDAAKDAIETYDNLNADMTGAKVDDLIKERRRTRLSHTQQVVEQAHEHAIEENTVEENITKDAKKPQRYSPEFYAMVGDLQERYDMQTTQRQAETEAERKKPSAAD